MVKDKNLGPLVSTDMTRCIHCTRCVRFGAEIQGYPQMGATGRGENMEIGTYIEHSVDDELSANIIDLCPVGALNNKPFRYHARAWEMNQAALVSPHDAFGTNLYAHVLRGRLMRMVPRENEDINETWIADRDRFGFEGMYSADRVSQPMLRIDGTLQAVDWEVALNAAAEGLQRAAAVSPAATGYLASPLATVEELHPLAQIARGLSCGNIDHRLRQLDFRAQENEAAYPHLGVKLAEVERLEGVLIVGSDLRREVPMLAHRIRKAAIKGGARVAFFKNPRGFDDMFPLAGYVAEIRRGGRTECAGACRGRCRANKPVPAGVRPATVTDAHQALIAALSHRSRRAVILGTLAQRHPAYSQLKALSAALAELCGASVGCITEGPNAAGAYLAGAVPHREAGGAPIGSAGLSARQMLDSPLKAYVLLGAIDPFNDLAVDPWALASADLVIAVTSHLPEALRSVLADAVVLPIGTFAETSGTYANAEGRWQSWVGASKLPGEALAGLEGAARAREPFEPAWHRLRPLE